MIRLFCAIALCLPFTASLAKTPFWGATESLPVETPVDAIADGQFIWDAGAATTGPVAVIVSLTEQRAYAYRNGVLIGVSSASTGKPGHETPTGVFVVLQKDKDHHSSTYNNAAMPYTERLTWDGVSLHAGGLPGYPSSHGCVHLPSEFARLLFDVSVMGMTVVVSDEHSAPRAVAHPGVLLPVDPATGAARAEAALGPLEVEHWTPERAPDGPLSIVASGADRRIVALRNGTEIGRARIDVVDPGIPLGTHVYVAGHKPAGTADSWIAVGVPGHEVDDGHVLDADSVSRLRMPDDFAEQLIALIEPGTTLLVTDGSILPETHAVEMQVVNSDPPGGQS